MPAIIKSEGVNASERYLASLADRSFLSLWAYPNVYRDHGKELCDLLVVCGNHVLVFSDKSVGWPDSSHIASAWQRWHNRAISKSASQLRRAINWLRSHPNRVFLDAKCGQKLPIKLPSSDKVIIHGIIVARGAASACLDYFGSGSGSLPLAPAFGGAPASIIPNMPFAIGNPAPSDEIYHIFDDVSLPVVLQELDTISDFVRYLAKKETLLKNEQLVIAAGEEDLLAMYLRDVNEFGEHDFVVNPGVSLKENERILVEEGSYNSLRQRDKYKRKKEADRISYFWDALIEKLLKIF